MNKLYNKSYILLFLLSLFIFETKFFLFGISKRNKNIFTFWEPHEKIPGYIHLCIKTWKKFLPDYQIKILDYETVKKYLGEKLFSQIICKNMTLPLQTDAIRVAVLKKFGGFWIDADTIILNGEFLKNYNTFDMVMFGDIKKKTQNIGFIFASHNSEIIDKWLKGIINNVRIYKKTMIIANSEKRKKINAWNYLGNGILDRLVKNAERKEFIRLDRDKLNAMPELIYYENSSLTQPQKYILLYFTKGEPQIVLNKTKNIILLHNSWTPYKYKMMSEKEFLNQDILLSKLLSKVLYKSI